MRKKTIDTRKVAKFDAFGRIVSNGMDSKLLVAL